MIYQKNLSQEKIDKIMKGIEVRSKTKTGKRLKELLYKISDDDLSVLDILLSLKTDEQKQLLIDELEDGLTDELTIAELTTAIDQGTWPVK